MSDPKVVHEKYHQAILMKAQAARQAKGKVTHREAYKQAVWAIQDHLACHHDVSRMNWNPGRGRKALGLLALSDLHGGLHSGTITEAPYEAERRAFKERSELLQKDD